MTSILPRSLAASALALTLALCAASQAAAAPALTPERWRELERVQSAVYAMPNRTDSERLGALDLWQPADSRSGGDCEDHALAARQRLLALGWPPSALRIAMGWTEQGDYHAVLTIDVATAKGGVETYVLDNRFARVEAWHTLSRYGYRWDRRQEGNGPGWVAIAS